MSFLIVNELTATSITLDFLPTEIPTLLEYRIDCVTNNQEILDWSVLTPAELVAILIHSNSNAIIDNSNDYEMRRITYRATYNIDDIAFGEKDYLVKNLSKAEL